MEDLKKLLIGELHDIYDGEHQLVDALPDMAEKANSPALKSAFQTHLSQTRGHVQRLEQAFNLLGESPNRRSCKGLEGIIDEGQIIATEYSGNSAMDAALIGAAQKVEHYEITSYGCLSTWAEELGLPRVASLLQETLSEEKATDAELTELARAEANRWASMRDTKKKSEASAATAKVLSKGF